MKPDKVTIHILFLDSSMVSREFYYRQILSCHDNALLFLMGEYCTQITFNKEEEEIFDVN